jgi:hypothetical protein
VRPYVIRQGDHLAKLAYKFGFDADTVWNDPANADLRKVRSDPNMLWPTDVVYIPDPVAPLMTALTPGSTNNFVSTSPTVDVSLKFTDPERQSQPYTITELPQLTNLTTGPDGTTTFQVPVSESSVTLVFTSDGAAFVCNIGQLDPINTLSGIVQRLQNLGLLDPAGLYDSSNLDAIRSGLRALREGQSPPDSSPPASSPPASTPPPASSPPASSPPASSSPASSPPPSSAPSSGSSSDDDPPPSSAPPSSEAPLSSAPALDTPPPSSSAPPSSPPSSPGEDDGGLSDDGTLDDSTAQLLLKTHGS